MYVLSTLEPFLLHTFFHFSIEINMYMYTVNHPFHIDSHKVMCHNDIESKTLCAHPWISTFHIHTLFATSKLFGVLWLLLLHACFIFGQSTANIPIFKGKTCSQQIHLGKRSYEKKKTWIKSTQTHSNWWIQAWASFKETLLIKCWTMNEKFCQSQHQYMWRKNVFLVGACLLFASSLSLSLSCSLIFVCSPCVSALRYKNISICWRKPSYE